MKQLDSERGCRVAAAAGIITPLERRPIMAADRPPKIEPCTCGTKRLPYTTRRRSASFLICAVCPVCRQRAPSSITHDGAIASWNDKMTGLRAGTWPK